MYQISRFDKNKRQENMLRSYFRDHKYIYPLLYDYSVSVRYLITADTVVNFPVYDLKLVINKIDWKEDEIHIQSDNITPLSRQQNNTKACNL